MHTLLFLELVLQGGNIEVKVSSVKKYPHQQKILEFYLLKCMLFYCFSLVTDITSQIPKTQRKKIHIKKTKKQ